MYEDSWIIGVDEVGVGSIMGPVVACACLIDPLNTEVIDTVQDSKKLSEKRRTHIADMLEEQCPYEIVSVEPGMADWMGVHVCRMLAMQKAAENLLERCEDDKPLVIVDGDTELLHLEYPQRAIVKADSKVPAVAAASILAKVYRDTLVQKLAGKKDVYGWKKNKGYATAKHTERILQNAVTVEHRPRAVHNTVRNYWKKLNGGTPAQISGSRNTCIMSCPNRPGSRHNVTILEPIEGTYQCPVCSAHSGIGGTRTVTDIEIYEKVLEQSTCSYCDGIKKRPVAACLELRHYSKDTEVLSTYRQHTVIPAGSSTVARFRIGHFCSECAKITWNPRNMGMWRLRKDEVEPTGEFAGRTPSLTYTGKA